MRSSRFWLRLVAAIVAFATSLMPRVASAARIPVVGCPADGQVGAFDPPADTDVEVKMSAAIAARLAFYRAKYSPVALAPRGWKCAGAYGSNGGQIFVTPEAFDGVLSGASVSGPAVLVWGAAGDTSGRYEVARVSAQLFRWRWAAVKELAASSDGFLDGVRFGAYPGDRLRYWTRSLVEFTTPANAAGIGTRGCRLEADADPVRGIVALEGSEPEPSANVTCVRLPRELADLTTTILRHARGKLVNPSLAIEQ